MEIVDYEEDLWSAAAAAVALTVVNVCTVELALHKVKHEVWVKRLFQCRQSNRSYEKLFRELRDDDPDSFRAYLQMDSMRLTLQYLVQQ